jgi:hypothetical protein
VPGNNPDSLTTVVHQIAPGTIMVNVMVGNQPDWEITGYNIYISDTLGIYAPTYFPSNERQFFRTYGIQDLGDRVNFFATVNYREIIDGQTLWGSHSLPIPH